MTSIVRLIRDKIRGIPKDAPLDYSQITENIYIGAWPTKYNVETINSLGVTLIIATILERTDKELNHPPLRLVHTRATDLGSRLIYPMSQLMKGVEPAVSHINDGGNVMVFCKAGKHRSAAMTSCVLVGLGHSTDEAIQIVENARPQAEIRESIRETIHNFELEWRKHYPQKTGGG